MEVFWVIGIVLFLVGFACGSAFAWSVANEEFDRRIEAINPHDPGFDLREALKRD